MDLNRLNSVKIKPSLEMMQEIKSRLDEIFPDLDEESKFEFVIDLLNGEKLFYLSQ